MPQDNAALAGRGDRQRKREPDGSLFLYQTASGIRFMRQQIAGTTPTRLRSFHTASGMRAHVTSVKRQGDDGLPAFQYRKRYEVTCDSVSGRPQKQKAQNAVLENLLKAERVIACFRLSLHTPRLCNDPAAPYVARLAAIRGKSENLPRFFASERFSAFHNVA